MKKPIMSVLLAIVLTAALAMPALSDTIVLRNGRSFYGRRTNATATQVTFQDENGRPRK